jgi:hypothetical protein
VISLLKNNTPFALLILVCLAAIPQFMHLQSTQPLDLLVGSTSMQGIAKDVIIFFGGNNTTLSNLWSTGFLLTEALLLNRIITNQKFADRLGMIPAASFLLLNLLLPVKISGFMLLICGLIIVVIEKMIAAYKNPKPNNTLIIAGFFSGIVATLGTPFLLLFLWLTGALLIMRPASLREWLLISIGFILPFYFLGSGLYLFDQLKLDSLITPYRINIHLPVIPQLQWINISLFIVLPWIGLMASRSLFNKMMIQSRKSYLIILVLYLAMVLICIANLSALPQMLPLLLIPASVMLYPIFSSSKKQFIPNLIFWLVVIASFMR